MPPFTAKKQAKEIRPNPHLPPGYEESPAIHPDEPLSIIFNGITAMNAAIPKAPPRPKIGETCDSDAFGDRAKLHFDNVGNRGRDYFRVRITRLHDGAHRIQSANWHKLWIDAHAYVSAALSKDPIVRFMASNPTEALRDTARAKDRLDDAGLSVPVSVAADIAATAYEEFGALLTPFQIKGALRQAARTTLILTQSNRDPVRLAEEITQALKELPNFPVSQMLLPFKELQKWRGIKITLLDALCEYRAELSDPSSVASIGKRSTPGTTSLKNYNSYLVSPLKRLVKSHPNLLLSEFANSQSYMEKVLKTPGPISGVPMTAGHGKQVLGFVKRFLEWAKAKVYIDSKILCAALSVRPNIGISTSNYHDTTDSEPRLLRPQILLEALPALSFDASFPISTQAKFGIRSEELLRILFSEYNHETNNLLVKRCKVKGRRYHVLFPEGMFELMKCFEGCVGLMFDPELCGARTFHAALASVTKEVVPDNCLRHLGLAVSRTTLPHGGTVVDLARQRGTSVKQIEFFYEAVVTEEMAQKILDYVPPIPKSYVIDELHVHRRFFGTIDMLVAHARSRGKINEAMHSVDKCISAVVEEIVVKFAAECRSAVWPSFTTKVKFSKNYDVSEYLNLYRSKIYPETRAFLIGKK